MLYRTMMINCDNPSISSGEILINLVVDNFGKYSGGRGNGRTNYGTIPIIVVSIPSSAAYPLIDLY